MSGKGPWKHGSECVAKHDFRGTRADDLSFSRGEVLIILNATRDPNWYRAKNNSGQEGMIPTNYVQKRERVKLHTMPWFHGKITREESESLLKPYNDGTFLVRESQHFPGDYTLSVSFEKHVEHYRVQYEESKGNKLTVDSESYFENLFKMVEHYQEDADGLVCRLIKPLQKKGQHVVVVDSDAFRESGWAIDRNKIKLNGTIASGNFGEVLDGEYLGKRVAIKQLKDDNRAAQAFLAEASIMTSLRHENLVELLGVVLENPLLLVMEFMEKGSLVEYLRSRGRSVVSKESLSKFAYHAACGMACLEENGLIHRDLAARNILISSDEIAKVSDFGLTAAAEQTQGGKELPIRWTAPEALVTKEFSTKSDVWSFGILLWEIYSFGKVPYPRIPIADVQTHVTKGYRMESPDSCPDHMYKLMRNCWDKNPAKRPTFSYIKKMLGTFQGSVTDRK